MKYLRSFSTLADYISARLGANFWYPCVSLTAGQIVYDLNSQSHVIPNDLDTVTVYIDGNAVSLDPDLTFAQQGYNEIYDKEYYDSSVEPNDNIADNETPSEGSHYYTFYYDTYDPEDEPGDEPDPGDEPGDETVYATVYIDGEEVTLDSNQTFAEQGYEEIYETDSYDSSFMDYEVPTNVCDDYPVEGENYYTSYTDIFDPGDNPDEPDPGDEPGDDSGNVEVIILEENSEHYEYLDPNKTWAENGYEGPLYDYYYYSPGEEATDHLIDVNTAYPYDGENVYTYCNLDDTGDDPGDDPGDDEPGMPIWRDIINDEDYVFDAGTIAVGQTKPVTVNNNVAKFSFTPENDGNYNIYAIGEEKDTVGAIFDSNGNMIASDDDSAGAGNFMLNVNLTGGETYYIHTTLYNYYYEESGSFDLVVEEIYEGQGDEPDPGEE